jgi:anaphase-promoting complex subunit 11
MKVKIKSYNTVASWRWEIRQKDKREGDTAMGDASTDDNNANDDDDEEDVCGICRVAFEGCCPNCKVPGDDCPLSRP